MAALVSQSHVSIVLRNLIQHLAHSWACSGQIGTTMWRTGSTGRSGLPGARNEAVDHPFAAGFVEIDGKLVAVHLGN